MVHPELADWSIIGQTGLSASGVLGFAGMRAPLFVPEWLSGFLFETHGLYWVLGVGAGLALIFAGGNRANRAMARAGAIVAGMTVVWVILAMLVVTPRERLYQAHQALAEAANKGDAAGIVSHMRRDFECAGISIRISPERKEELEETLKRYGIKANHITGYKSDIFGPTATTWLTLLTEADLGVVKTSWVLTWEDVEGDDWKIKVADLKAVGDTAVSGGQVIP